MTSWRTPVFGVRHLSPAGAWHVRRWLDRIRPSIVLIEGLHDATELASHLVRKGTKPPVAILAYTDALPMRTLVLPLARYSPEYQAVQWAYEHDVPVEFIDLPSDVFLALQDRPTEEDGSSTPMTGEPEESLFQRFARSAGEDDYEAYWERRFEHNFNDEAYRLAAFEFGSAIRTLDQSPARHVADNVLRESHMRRRIAAAMEAGHEPDRIAAVVGAYHAPVLNSDHPVMTDAELALLPRRSSKLTLMPYSYFRLSSQSGYGAGNKAPAYFELLWDAVERQAFDDLPAVYLASVARVLRESGSHRSSADVIEGVRLARTLSALRDGSAPTLQDLHDAARTVVAGGQPSSVVEALARVDVGTAVGELPEGVARTSIQADFAREVATLKLEKYRTTVLQDLTLDLRENRQAKTEAAAFLDLRRSSFLHRLRVLDVGFGQFVASGADASTWAEKWRLAWTPECEISLVEAVLLGDTIELAAAYRFRQRIDQCTDVAAAAAIIRDACQCGLAPSMESARGRLQELAAGSSEFVAIARAAYELGAIVRFGDVRKFDASPLLPLIETLFVQGALALDAASKCDDAAAVLAAVAMDELNRVSLDFSDRVDEPLWMDAMRKLADADDRNPMLSGFACAMLLERGLMPNDVLAREVSRRLSPGVPADLGAGWFSGLAKRNRHALISRQSLWEQIAAYVASLDEEQFRRALVFLRRAFGSFGPTEKRQIAENLGHYWGCDPDVASEVLGAALTEAESQKLEELNEFDFDDI